MNVLCLGWDVGGWQGRKDGLAGISLSDEGHPELISNPARVRFGPEVARGELTMQTIIKKLELSLDVDKWHRVILGVDAPLGYPSMYIEEVTSSISEASNLSGDLPEKFIDHPLAYRHTDRCVDRLYPHLRSPITGSLSWLSNNVSKARCALAQLIERNGFLVPPFDQVSDQDTRIAVEVYPALWLGWAGSDTSEDGYGRLRNAIKNCVSPGISRALANAGNKDERDAILAALAAACYEAARRRLGGPLPAVLRPAKVEHVSQEGWIYAPVREDKPECLISS